MAPLFIVRPFPLAGKRRCFYSLVNIFLNCGISFIHKMNIECRCQVPDLLFVVTNPLSNDSREEQDLSSKLKAKEVDDPFILLALQTPAVNGFEWKVIHIGYDEHSDINVSTTTVPLQGIPFFVEQLFMNIPNIHFSRFLKEQAERFVNA
ncbi:hypothetical protein PJK55_08300 [Exiguobacterium sp. MMG028]|uniref:hypothetical protein n=1 Tax=Exiguobacterium sp. MMG028 TaxID=3021979 RepID=UPI0022FDE93E|nr:hypothetical protein [Exiguobacterium sp. MMG028]MDA5560727.1 hypothetical protein [Exiguobacterium sp. MMG028]